MFFTIRKSNFIVLNYLQSIKNSILVINPIIVCKIKLSSENKMY